jgi:integrase
VPWLFFRASGKRLESLNYIWKVLREQLGRPEIRIQDLRHSFVRLLVDMGMETSDIRSIMGHYQTDTLNFIRQQKAV